MTRGGGRRDKRRDFNVQRNSPITTPEHLSSLIGDIYDTALESGRWPSVLERVCGFVQATAANLYWQDAVDRTAVVAHSHNLDPHYVRLYQDVYVHLNPLLPAAVFIEPGLVYTGGDIVPHDEFRQTRFYKEWVAPQGTIDALGFNIQRDSTGCATFAMHIGADYGVADDATRRRVGLIAPHILRAVLIGRQIRRAEGSVHDYETILDAHGAAVFLVGDRGQIRFSNEAGRALLDEGLVVSERDGCLTSPEAQATRLLRAAATDEFPKSQDRKAVSIPLSETGPRWLADVLPLGSGRRLAFGADYDATSAVFIRRAEIPARSGIEIMTKLYKLRASEVRVLYAMTRDSGGVDELAETLGISVSTVKTHLNALFAKTGTSRQADLVREVAAHGGPLM